MFVLKKILGGAVLQPTPIPATAFPGSRFQVFSQTFGLAIPLGNPAFKQLVSGSSFPIFSSSQTFWFKNSSGQLSLQKSLLGEIEWIFLWPETNFEHLRFCICYCQWIWILTVRCPAKWRTIMDPWTQIPPTLVSMTTSLWDATAIWTPSEANQAKSMCGNKQLKSLLHRRIQIG